MLRFFFFYSHFHPDIGSTMLMDPPPSQQEVSILSTVPFGLSYLIDAPFFVLINLKKVFCRNSIGPSCDDGRGRRGGGGHHR